LSPSALRGDSLFSNLGHEKFKSIESRVVVSTVDQAAAFRTIWTQVEPRAAPRKKILTFLARLSWLRTDEPVRRIPPPVPEPIFCCKFPNRH
jgi:hypothetical protein